MSARLAFVEARDRRAAAQAAHCAAGVKKSKKHCALVMILRIMARKRSKPTNRKHLNGTRDGGITMGNYMRSYNDRELQIFDEEQRVDAWIANLIGELSPAYEESPPPCKLFLQILQGIFVTDECRLTLNPWSETPETEREPRRAWSSSRLGRLGACLRSGLLI